MTPPSAATPAAPSESLYRRAPTLTPEVLRAEIQRLTADQLDQLVREMDAARNVPLIFRNVLVRNAIDERIAAADATRERWQELQRLIEAGPPPLPPAPPPAPLPPEPTPMALPPQPSSGGITGETGIGQWAGDHKGMIAATAGLAILGFFAIRHFAKMKEERTEEEQRRTEAIAEGREPPKPKSWLRTLLFPAAAVGGGARAIEAYKRRKEIAAKAKEGAEKTQKAVKESAEAQEGIESARYGLVSAGLLLLDRDLMPESTRISDAQRRRILTGFLEDNRVQNVPVSQVLSIENERDVVRVFGDVIANRPADERHVLFFLAQSCKKHQEYVTGKARHLGLSDEEIMQMPLIEYVDQLAEVSSTFGQLTKEITEKGVDGLKNIDWNKDIFNIPQFIHHLKNDRIFTRKITEHYPELQTKENDFLKFCAANGGKTMHNLSQQLRENIPEDKKRDWEMFQGILQSMHQYVQDQFEYIKQFTHGQERFARPLQEYFNNHLTVFDTVQLYYYLQHMIGPDGNFLELKDAPHTTAFLLQTKVIGMVKRENEEEGQRMFYNLIGRGVGSAVGIATNIQIPPKAKELFTQVAGGLLKGAEKMLTESVHKVKQFYQSGVVGANKEFGLLVTGSGYALLQIKLNSMLDASDAKWFSRTSAKKIASRYGISEEVARAAKDEARNYTGKGFLQKFDPAFESRTMHDGKGGVWKIIEEGQAQMDNILKGGNIEKHFINMQGQLEQNATTFQSAMKVNPSRADAKNVIKMFNQQNQKILDDALNTMSAQVSKTNAKTFEELLQREPHLAQAITRGMQQKSFTSVLGNKIGIVKKTGQTMYRGLQSRTRLFVPMICLRALTSEEKIPIANLAGSTAIQLTPLVGTGYDVLTLITGKDQITGEEIPRWQSVGFVAVGAATDTLTVLGAIFGFGVGGGAGVAARAAAFGARAGAKTVKLTKNSVKAAEAMTKATRIALKAEKIAKVARWTRLGGVTYTIGGIGFGLYFSDGEAPQEQSDDLITGS